MKKISLSLIAFLGVLVLFTSGCTKKEYVGDGSGQAESEIFKIVQNNWQLDKNSGVYYATLNLTTFNDDIHLNGAYWAYISFDNEVTYTLLATSLNNYTFDADFIATDNGYQASISATPFTDNSSAPSQDIIIKVVSIPSTVVQSNVNMKDYNAVKAAYHLK